MESEDAIGGGANIGVASGDLSNSQTTIRGTETEYNPEWLLPLEVIESLDERGYIAKSLGQATMGKLVLLSGEIKVVDIRLLRDIWEPVLGMLNAREDEKAGLPDGVNRTQRKKLEQALKVERKSRDKQTGLVVGLLKPLPHSVQMSIETEAGAAWATLDASGMTMPPGDLALKHGYRVEGRWNVLGVLDARPDQQPKSDPAATNVRESMQKVCDLARNLLGRPYDAYGITPVMVFRAIKPVPETELGA